MEDKIYEEVVYDSLEFLSFIRENSMSEILLTCQDSDTGYLLSLSNDCITWKKLGWHKNTSRTFHECEKIDGWTRFRLGLKNTITLHGNDKSWLPEGLNLDCTVQSVDIKNGTFTQECTSNTPTWLVKNGKAVNIPLRKDDARENLTLFSRVPFKPSFSVKGAELEMGRRGNALVTSGHKEPLPPTPHSIHFQIFLEEDAVQLKVTPLHLVSLTKVMIALSSSDMMTICLFPAINCISIIR